MTQPRITPSQVEVAEARRTTLPNGIGLYTLASDDFEVLRISFVFRAGSALQQAPFSASAAANLLSEGSRDMTAHQIAEQLDYYGSWYDVNVDRDYAYINFATLSKFFDPTLAVAEQILLCPAFPEEELRTYAAKRRQRLAVERAKIDVKAREEGLLAFCRARNIPIRIGVNAGSLDKALLEKYGHPCPEALVESAAQHAALLEKYDFYDICLSMKSSSVPMTIAANSLASERFEYPLHLGVTETGTEWNGTIQSAVGIGTLLSEGIGNTIRVSLTADPVREVSAGIAILKAAGVRKGGVRFVSCPTCGRTEIDLISLANKVEGLVRNLDRDITVAVMGCVVNGPGEAREADYGIAGGKNKGLLFKKGEVLGTYPYDELCGALMELIEKDGAAK